MSLRWIQSLTDDIDSTCIRVETRSADSRTNYRIETPSLENQTSEVSVTAPGAASVITPLQQRGASPGFEETVSVPNNGGVKRVIISWDDGRGVVYLPSASFLEECKAAINEDRSAAESVLQAFQTPVQLPLICGAFLDLDDLIALVDTVTDTHSQAASTIHSYRYPIVRSALANPTGLSVSSAADFEALVNGFDAIEAIGYVSLIDSVADTMLTTHSSVTETDELIQALGYDLSEFEQRNDGWFFACYLAHAVLTDGVSAARGHAMQRRRHLDANYERGKVEARNASHHERGRKWRRLICAAARESKGEFVYVLTNVLYWTGYTTRSDSRTQEFLCAGATAAVDLINLPELAGWAQFEHHVAAGHRLRSRNQFAAAVDRFSEAKEIARRYKVLPEWQAQYNEVVVRAHAQDRAGNHEEAMDTLETGIETLLGYDLRPETATRVIHHLKGQSCEIEAELAHLSDPQKARSLLAEASDHYDVIDFTRSRNRTKRKRRHIDPTPEDTGHQPPEVDTPNVSESTESETPIDMEPSETKPSSESMSGDGTTTDKSYSHLASAANVETDDDPSPLSQHRNEPESFPEPDGYPELNDSLTPHDESKTGSGDIMSGPDAQQGGFDTFGADDTRDPDWY